MIFLLDTHTFLWWDAEPAKLSGRAYAAIRDPASTVLLSVVSVREMQIKTQLGKLSLRLTLPQVIAEQQANGIQVLPATLAHVLAVEALPSIHKDPFDRLLTAQSIVEAAEFVTADPIFAQYPVRVFW